MLMEVKLELYENDQLTDTVVKETSLQPSELIMNLEEFRISVNEVLTKKIENSGLIGKLIEDDIICSDEDEEESAQDIKAKKRKT